jgi:hypothetical protein
VFVLQGENCMSAEKAMNMRKKVYALQSKLSNAAKESLDRKFGALYDKVYREDVLMESWRLVRLNKGASGVDELIRYADDWIVLVKGDGRRVLTLLTKMLDRLQLRIHPEKTRITNAYRGFDFLSVHFRMRPVRKRKSRLKERRRLWPSNKAIMRVKQKIRDTISTRYSLKLEEVNHELNPVIRGWNNYHTRIQAERFLRLNQYVRGCIRIFLKRKYNDRTRGLRRIADGLPAKLGLAQFG